MAIVFAHGWGFDHHLWDRVRAQLRGTHCIETVDFGFLGTPHLPSIDTDEAVIAVGHSLGACWWLTQSPIAWQRLLIINGFPRFTECDGYAPAVAPRLLARMQTQFAREPAAVLAEFHTRCGTPPNAAHGAKPGDIARLGNGLQWLADWDGRAALARRAGDVHVLAGTADPIVPQAMTQMAFATLPADHVTWSDAPGHVLPLVAPDLCARWIENHLA